MVPRAGVEPARPKPAVFETALSTSSSIWARWCSCRDSNSERLGPQPSASTSWDTQASGGQGRTRTDVSGSSVQCYCLLSYLSKVVGVEGIEPTRIMKDNGFTARPACLSTSTLPRSHFFSYSLDTQFFRDLNADAPSRVLRRGRHGYFGRKFLHAPLSGKGAVANLIRIRGKQVW